MRAMVSPCFVIGFFGEWRHYDPITVLAFMGVLLFVLYLIEGRSKWRFKNLRKSQSTQDNSFEGSSADNNAPVKKSGSLKKGSRFSLGKIFNFFNRKSGGSGKLLSSPTASNTEPIDRLIWFAIVVMYVLLFLSQAGK